MHTSFRTKSGMTAKSPLESGPYKSLLKFHECLEVVHAALGVFKTHIIGIV